MKIESYSEPQWRRAREQALRRDKYIDQYQKQFGRLRNAEMVHHIFPVEDFPQYALCMWNLISLTRASHNLMHDRYTNELTDLGKDLLRRTAVKNNIPIPVDYLASPPGSAVR